MISRVDKIAASAVFGALLLYLLATKGMLDALLTERAVFIIWAQLVPLALIIAGIVLLRRRIQW